MGWDVNVRFYVRTHTLETFLRYAAQCDWLWGGAGWDGLGWVEMVTFGSKCTPIR